jgi:hypothetical protein
MPFFLLKTAFLSQINNLKQAHSGCSVAIFSNFLVYKIYLRNRQGDAWYVVVWHRQGAVMHCLAKKWLGYVVYSVVT